MLRYVGLDCLAADEFGQVFNQSGVVETFAPVCADPVEVQLFAARNAGGGLVGDHGLADAALAVHYYAVVGAKRALDNPEGVSVVLGLPVDESAKLGRRLCRRRVVVGGQVEAIHARRAGVVSTGPRGAATGRASQLEDHRENDENTRRCDRANNRGWWADDRREDASDDQAHEGTD